MTTLFLAVYSDISSTVGILDAAPLVVLLLDTFVGEESAVVASKFSLWTSRFFFFFFSLFSLDPVSLTSFIRVLDPEAAV